MLTRHFSRGDEMPHTPKKEMPCFSSQPDTRQTDTFLPLCTHPSSRRLLLVCYPSSSCSLRHVRPGVGMCAQSRTETQATNDTDYLLLTSQDVSVFFDNSFVAKTSLTAVSPGESFQTFLGIDPAVKV